MDTFTVARAALLVWDAIELHRPAIDAKVFALIAAHEFARSDFLRSGYKVHLLMRDVTHAFEFGFASRAVD
jgi:CRISPR/Cas system-associated endonuclease Cas1